MAADAGLHLRSIHRRATSERCETGLEIEAHFGFYQSSNVPQELGREQVPILTYRGTDFLPEDLRYTPFVLAILKGPRVRVAPSPSLFQRLNSAAGGERSTPFAISVGARARAGLGISPGAGTAAGTAAAAGTTSGSATRTTAGGTQGADQCLPEHDATLRGIDRGRESDADHAADISQKRGAGATVTVVVPSSPATRC